MDLFLHPFFPEVVLFLSLVPQLLVKIDSFVEYVCELSVSLEANNGVTCYGGAATPCSATSTT